MSETITAPAAPADGGDAPSIEQPNDYDAYAEHAGLDLPTESDDSHEGDDADDEDGEKIKLKVNGKTVEKSLKDVIKSAQLYEATQQKLEQVKEEAAKAKQMQEQVSSQQNAIRSILQVLQRGDIGTIADFVHEHLNAGEQFNRAVIQYALHLYEQSKWTPEQREADANRKLVMKLRQEAEQRQKVDQQRAMEYHVAQWTEHINVEIPAAIKEVGLPSTDFVREQIITTWRNALERGQTPTAKAVAAFVKKRLEEANVNLGTGKVKATRPKATRESVRRSNGVDNSSSSYVGFEEWKKSRRH